MIVIVATFAASLVGSFALGEDDVVHRRRGIILRGKIVSYDSTGVRIKLDGNKETFIPADELERVEVKRTREHEEAEKLLDEHNYAAAAVKLTAALKSESRPWLRGQLAAKLVASHMAAGDPAAAIDAFITAARTPDSPVSWNAIPLYWLHEPAPQSVHAHAATLLRSTNALHQVIAASYLFETDQATAARETLERLSKFPDEQVAQLARTQLWRWNASSASPADISTWEKQVARLAPDLRAGPMFVIGWTRKRLGEHEQAAVAFLWPAIVAHADRNLAARALFLAGESLEAAGRPGEARQLYQEVVDRFSPGRDSVAARGRLNQLKE